MFYLHELSMTFQVEGGIDHVDGARQVDVIGNMGSPSVFTANTVEFTIDNPAAIRRFDRGATVDFERRRERSGIGKPAEKAKRARRRIFLPEKARILDLRS